MKKVDVEMAILIIGLILFAIVGIIMASYNDLITKTQYTNNLTIVIGCRKNYSPNALIADRICGSVPQWYTYERRNNQ
jgi:capsular polysaccharide biosynthesis protein